MQITDVRVRKITKEGKMKAVVSITLDDEFVVHDIKVIEGEKGLFIAMPSKKATDGEYRDIAHPINSSTRENLQRVIFLLGIAMNNPFSTIRCKICGDVSIDTQMAFSSRSMERITPVPSIWPLTMCPPNLPSAAIARSRFTWLPALQLPRLLLLIVSAITSAVNPSG